MRERLKPGVYIALPTALALSLAIGGSISIWWLRDRLSTGARASQPPVYRSDQRALPTYKRKCLRQADCDYPLVCMPDPRVGALWKCMASECETDAHCELGFVCTPFNNPGLPTIRFCLPQGTQEEGERCEDFNLKEERGCLPGLICIWGYCGRPCDSGDPSTCPRGFVCHGRNDPPACLPSCLRGGCPPDKECIRMDGEFSVCATVHGQNCDKQPCPAGEACRRELGHFRSKAVNMWCAIPCNEKDGGSCPAGSICWGNECSRPCDERDAGSCGPDEECTMTAAPGEVRWVCRMRG